MIVGLDLDNTIACFDRVFRSVAMRVGLVGPDVPADKKSVQRAVRAGSGEEAWTRLQGLVYGPHMVEAEPFPGVVDFCARASAAGVDLRVISHRTRQPVLGEPHDLHAAARRWLEDQGFHGRAGVRRDGVFLDVTREQKIDRIVATGCEVFIDDLAEVLQAPTFPQGVRRILFSPAGAAPAEPGLEVAESWADVANLLLPVGSAP